MRLGRFLEQRDDEGRVTIGNEGTRDEYVELVF